jgi:hypothetical protein
MAQLKMALEWIMLYAVICGKDTGSIANYLLFMSKRFTVCPKQKSALIGCVA